MNEKTANEKAAKPEKGAKPEKTAPSTEGSPQRRRFRLRISRPWINWICGYPLLLGEAALLVGLLAFYLGEDFGLPKLFWHDSAWQQFFAGLGTIATFGVLIFVGYLLDSDKRLAQSNDSNKLSRAMFRLVSGRPLPETPEESSTILRTFCWYLSVMAPVFLLLASIPAVYWFESQQMPTWGFRLGRRWPFLLGEMAFVAGCVLLSMIYLRVRPERSPRNWRFFDKVPRPLRAAHVVGSVFFAMIGLVYVVLVILNLRGLRLLGSHFPAALGICLLLCLIAAAWGWVAFYFRRAQLPVIAAIAALAILMNSLPLNKLRFPHLDHYYDAPAVRLADYEQNLREADRLAGQRPRNATGDDLATGLVNSATALENWRRLQGDARPKLVVVATQGGGIRAAVWTMIVLNQMETKLPHRPDASGKIASPIRLVTGASGGMLGAAYYAASLNDRGAHSVAGAPLSLDTLRDDLCQDTLTPQVQQYLMHDLPLSLLPFSSKFDRGQALEEAWRQNTHELLGVKFRDLRPGEREGWRPSLVFTPTLVEDGRRLLISNLDLHALLESKGSFLLPDQPDEQPTAVPPARTEPRLPLANVGATHGPTHGQVENLPHETANTTSFHVDVKGYKRTRDKSFAGNPELGRYALAGIEYFRLLPEKADDEDGLRLSTAVRMNASFPYVSPAVSLPTEPRRRVVDAAYYDNYGVNVASLWIAAHRRWLSQNTSGVVLVQIRDFLTEEERRSLDESAAQNHLSKQTADSAAPRGVDQSWSFERGFEGVTGPLSGLFAATGAVTSFRNDEQVQALDEYFNSNARPRFFTTVVFECPRKVALNWYLSEESRTELIAGFAPPPAAETSAAAQPDAVAAAQTAENNRGSLERLLRWWNGR